jgi:hypothetical protein
MDVTPPEFAGPVAAYPRSAVDEFLANAATEQTRLERAIADARARERRASFAAEESEATARLLRSSLHDLRQELADRRRQTETQAEALIAAARDEAAGILAQARVDARVQTRVVEAVPRPTPVVAAQSPTSASPATPSAPRGPVAVAPEASSTAVVTAPAPRPVPRTGNGASSRPSSDAIPVSRAEEAAALFGVPSTGPTSTSGSEPGPSASGPTNGDRSAPASSTTTIDLTREESAAKRTGFAGRLRRRRDPEPEPESDPKSDEFLDFLRGALLDDSPLDRSGDAADDPVRWQWER